MEYFSALTSGYRLLQERSLLSAVCLCQIQPRHRGFLFVRADLYSGAECCRCRSITQPEGGGLRLCSQAFVNFSCH